MILPLVLSFLVAFGDAPAKPAVKPKEPDKKKNSAPAEKPVEGDDKFHPEDYPSRATKQVLKELPCAKGETSVKDALFSFEAVYQGASRATPKARMAMVQQWTKAIGDPEAAPKYSEEITVLEGTRSWWMPVPAGLYTFMSMDMLAGDRFTAYAVFVGCVDGEPLFALDEFEMLEQKDAEIDDQLI